MCAYMVGLHLTLESIDRDIERGGYTQKVKVIVYDYLNEIHYIDILSNKQLNHFYMSLI